MASTSPQPRKYLCQAPRPEQYEELAENVLKQIPATEQIRVLTKVIEAARKEHPLRPQGPGRKSNAEHAIAFYEYVLDKALQHDHASIDTEAFSKAHNDLCEVCDQDGNLLMCSSCNLVFHLDCVRPALEKLPEGDWNCAYCVKAQEPKSSRKRRDAVAAIRIMARLRNQKKQRQDETPKRRNLELDRLEGSASDDTGRGKRNRKQPTLYDDQGGPARLWRSDETPLKTKHESSESETEEEEETAGDDTITCNFCYDDPEIPLCVFCGCRVCFGKADTSRMLLCDKCDDEYHMFCLDPPLPSIPKTTWYCPSCAVTRREKRTPDRRQSSPNSNAGTSSNRGTPPRKKMKVEDEARSESSLSVTKSRSGRTVKRKQHHDEIDEGEQHLKSVRLAETITTKSSKSTPKSTVPSDNHSSKIETGESSDNEEASVSVQDNEAVPDSATEDPFILAPSSSNTIVAESADHEPLSMANPIPPETTTDTITSAAKDGSADLQTDDDPAVKFAKMDPPIGGSVQPEIKEESKPTVDINVTAGTVSDTIAVEASVPEASSNEPLNAASTPSATAKNSESPEEKEVKQPRRKPGARECMQISRRFGSQVIPEKYMEILLDYCSRGKVEHLIRMRERLDEHARFLESQLAGLEALVKENGETDVVVPAATPQDPEITVSVANDADSSHVDDVGKNNEATEQ